MKIRIGHSPDPDDAFMFYALAKGKIPTDGFQVSHVIEPIERLNERAQNGELEVTAVSFHAFLHLKRLYALLPYGASVGDGYGPIVVAREPLKPADLLEKRAALPGRWTTAALLWRLYLQNLKSEIASAGSASLAMTRACPVSEETFLPFDEIPSAVIKGVVDVGILIHEGQLTYSKDGLVKIVDLGAWWKAKTGLPAVLGVDVVRRDLGEEMMRRIGRLLKNSISYALSHREDALAYALTYGRGMDPRLGDRFVDMYVNQDTLEFGPRVMEGARRLAEEASRNGWIDSVETVELVKC